jgi:hypothetical protein
MAQASKEPKKIEASSQQYLPIEAIKEGVVLMTDHSLKSVVLVSSINFALKGEQEKDAIIGSFQNFLNSLEFPIQILATSRQLDLSNYLETVQKEAGKQANPLLKIQTEEYINFVNELLTYSSIMEKRFYVVVPYYPSGTESVPGLGGFLKKKKTEYVGGSFEEHKQKLLERTQLIIQGMSSLGLRSAALGTEDLLELFYSSYNPQTAQNQKIANLDETDVPIVSAQPAGAEQPKELL